MATFQRRPLRAAELPNTERRNFLKRAVAFLAGGAAVMMGARRASADVQGGQPFVGDIVMVGFNYAPRGWALCDGQLLQIASYQTLFSLLGTQYGGDGRTTFGLPDLRGRFPMHMGQGPGLSNRRIGAKSGTENVVMAAAQMPAHNHALFGQSSNGTSDAPAGNMLARDPAGTPGYGDGAANVVGMHASSIGNAGGSQAQPNMPPFQVVNFIIALTGLFPSRS